MFAGSTSFYSSRAALRAIAFESLKGTDNSGCGKTLFWNRFVTGHDLTGCGKTPSQSAEAVFFRV
jgi:hypothetical protein